MKLQRLGALLLLTTVLGACTDKGDLASLPEAEIPREDVLRQLCLGYLVYVSIQDPQYFPNGAYCTERPVFSGSDVADVVIDRLCRPGVSAYDWAEGALAAAEAGRIELDFSGLVTCVEEARTIKSSMPAVDLQSDPAWLSLEAGACASFIRGTVADGGACLDDWDCAAEGSGCYTDTPFEPGTLRCMPAALDGEPCSDWHACIPDFYCSVGTCAPIYPGLAAGEECQYGFDCAGDCVTCLPDGPSDTTRTCRSRGGLGDYCEVASDCADDLGCVNSQCSSSAEGESCRTAPCAADLACTSGCWDFDNREAECTGNADCTYYFDSFANYGYCEPNEGSSLDYRCGPIPAPGEPCLYGLCPPGTFCSPDSYSCAAFANEGQPCSADATGAPACWAFLTCTGGVCVAPCEVEEDCGAGQACDVDTGECVALEEGRCSTDAHCADASYCASCGYVETQQSCLNTTGCNWMVTGMCESSCWAFDGNEPGCTARPECSWSAGLEWCLSVCGDHDSDQAACEAAPGCTYDPAAYSSCDEVEDCATMNETACAASQTCAWDATYAWCSSACYNHTVQADCEADARCGWDFGYCWTSCFTQGWSDEVSCNALAPYCAWTVRGSCDSAQCGTYSADRTTCENTVGCSYAESGSCEAAGPAATFSCQERLPMGEPCNGNEMCASGTCAENESGSLVCAEKAWEEHWFNVKWLLRLMVILSGVLILGGRRVR